MTISSIPKVKIAKIAKKEVLGFLRVIKTLRTKLTKKELQKRIEIISHIPEHHFWGATYNGERVGFCHASISINLSPGGKDIYLNDLIVLEKNRYNGIGSKLIKEVHKIASKKQCARMLVTVRTDNLSALKFYRRKGFERRGWARLVKEL